MHIHTYIYIYIHIHPYTYIYIYIYIRTYKYHPARLAVPVEVHSLGALDDPARFLSDFTCVCV